MLSSDIVVVVVLLSSVGLSHRFVCVLSTDIDGLFCSYFDFLLYFIAGI